jgi:hypothetical protein
MNRTIIKFVPYPTTIILDIVWPKPLTEMTVVKLSYLLKLTKSQQFYISILNVRSKSDYTTMSDHFKVNGVRTLGV